MIPRSFRREAGLRASLCAILLAATGLSRSHADPIPAGKPASYPDWWFSRSAIRRINPANQNPSWPADYRPVQDFAALNQGQLKAIASAGYDELEASFPGGAGLDVTNLVKSWCMLDSVTGEFLHDPVTGRRIPKAVGDDFKPVNLGQLKAVAEPFYDRFMDFGLAPSYPWILSTAYTDDYAVSNLGQAKNLFRFVTAWLDSDDDGVPDWWAAAAGVDRLDADGVADPAEPLAPAGTGVPDGIALAPDAVGPNGGPRNDDGIDPPSFPSGLSLWGRRADSFESKTIAFPAYRTTAGGITKYYLLQSERYSMSEGFPDLDPTTGTYSTSYTITSGAAATTLNPRLGTRTHRASENISVNSIVQPRKSRMTMSEFLHLPLRERPIYEWYLRFNQRGNMVTQEHPTGESWEEVESDSGEGSFTGTERRLWGGADYLSAGYWLGAWSYTSNGTTDGGPLFGLPITTIDKDAKSYISFDDAIGDRNIRTGLVTVDATHRSFKLDPPASPDPATDYPEKIRYSLVLGMEYTTERLKAQSITNHPDYFPNWIEQSFGDQSLVAWRNLNDAETDLTNEKFQYKFHVKGNARPMRIAWFEVFVPEAAPDDRKFILRTWDVPQDDQEHDSTIYEIDPAIRDLDGYYFLMPVEGLLVDGNRDGEMSFSDPIIHNKDGTSASNPYRFWLNNDRDEGDDDQPVDGHPDWQKDTINQKRDLEDFTRLWISFKGITDMIKQVGFELQLEWKPVEGASWTTEDGSPMIKLFKAVEADGGRKYLEEDVTADEQIGAAYGTTYGRAGWNMPLTLALTPVTLANLTESNPNLYLLFEGVSSGKGRLVINLLKGGQKIGEYPPLYLDLRDIKNMYERWTVDPPLGVPTSGADPLQGAVICTRALPTGQTAGFRYNAQGPEDHKYVVFAHGWNMAPLDKDQFAETAYKRLFWQGYKGRFAAFQWPTTHGFNPNAANWHDWDTVHALGLDRENYDNGEHIAWRSARWLENLLIALNGLCPGEVYLMGHSMGNVVAGEALRLLDRDNVKLNTYVACEAAVEAECYDSATATNFPLHFDYEHPLEVNLGQSNPAPLNYGPITPSIYQNWLVSSIGGVDRKINFYNVNDFALYEDVWEFNEITKPDNTGLFKKWGWGATPQDNRFYWSITNPIIDFHPLDLGDQANVNDRYEIMAHAAEPRSRALGRTPGTIAGFAQTLDLQTVWPEEAGKTAQDQHRAVEWHSGQFLFTNMKQKAFWRSLLDAFNLLPQ